MKTRFQLAAMGLLLAASCTPPTSTADPTVASTPPLVAKPAPQQPGSADTLRVVNDNLVGQLFKTLAYSKVRPDLRQPARQLELTPNEEDTTRSDSLLTYVAGRNSFTFLKSSLVDTSAGLLRCRLLAAPAHLPSSLRLGMRKEELARVLGQSAITTDVVLLTEQEGYQQFPLLFRDGLLAEIRFESNYLG